MEHQERCVLDGFYKNAAVGVDATASILSKVQQSGLREELCKQLKYYEEQKQTVRQQMQEYHMQPTETGAMAKLCSNMSIQMRTLGGASTSEIAKLMVEGTNMGIIQLTQVMHSHPDINDKLKRQGKAIVRHEEAYMERLKAYL